MKFTVSILCYIALRQAKACIASVLKSKGDFKLILTANGNPDAAKYFNDLAKEFANIAVVVNEKNEGYIEPQKKAFALCDTPFFVMLNDDSTVPPDWLEKLAEPFDRFPKAALSAPKGGCQTLLPSFHGVKGSAFEYLNGACLCCKTEIFRKHGLFDPNLKWAYGDDSDMSLRMREAGYTLHYADFILQHEIGATSRHVKDVKPYQDSNHAYLRKRWAHYIRVRKMDYPIIVRRIGAFGDVLLTTPIIRALKNKYPLSPIYVETACPQVFLRNPDVKMADRKLPKMSDALIFVLDGSYEAKPAQHFIKTYAERCGLTPEEVSGYRTQLFPSPQDFRLADQKITEGDWVAVHSGPSTWRSKEWPLERFSEVISNLRSLGHKIVLVGSPGKPLSCDLDMRGKTTVHEMAALIQRTKLFIGLDSFPLHVAQAMGVPVVGLFGVTDPQWIITAGSRSESVCGTTPSFGLRHRVIGQTSCDDKGDAMNSITVQMVLDAAGKILKPEVEFA